MKISLSSFAYSVEAHEKVIFSSTVPTSLISMNVHECSEPVAEAVGILIRNTDALKALELS